MVAEYHNQSKLRFWCQMVLPLVYDDSLSYMELLNKVVSYLNNCIQDVGNCETNIESLLEAFVNLQDYVNEISEDITPIIEEKLDEMIESGEFGEILADVLATVVAPEYDSTESYVPLNYAIKDGTLYCCTGNTTGEWDSTKWRETTVGDELNTLMQRVFALNAGQVSFDESATYSSGTVGNKLKNLSANDIAYNSSETYNDATVGKELSNLNGAINSIASDLAPVLTQLKADTNLAVGDLRVYNNRLYRVTQAVSSGANLKVGTNIAPVNLSTINQTYSGTANSYTKMADGTLIQWGEQTIAIEQTMVQVGSLNLYYGTYILTFDLPFKDTHFCMNVQSQYGTGYLFPATGNPRKQSASDQTSISATIWYYDVIQRQASETASLKIRWCAIGRWK